MLCWLQHAFIWKLQRIELSSKVWKLAFGKLCKLIQVAYNIWQLRRKCFETFFCFVLLIKRWHFLTITDSWHFRYRLWMGVLQITQIRQVTLYQWWIVVNNFLNWFCFVLSCNMNGVMLRLLMTFFLGMFCKLVFCKSENMRWPSNNLKYLTEVLGQNDQIHLTLMAPIDTNVRKKRHSSYLQKWHPI